MGNDPRTRARHLMGIAVPAVLCASAVWVWGQAPTAASVQADARARAASAQQAASGGASGSDGAGVSDGAGSSDGSGGSTPGQTASPGATPGQPDSADGGSSGGPATPTPRGPGVDEPGATLSVTATATGDLEVSERARTTTEVTRVVLRPPRIVRAGSDFADARPVLTEVQLTADGQPVVLPSERVTGRIVVDLPTPAMAYELRYVLEGATVRSVPSTAGRALAALAPASTTSVTGADTLVAVRTSGDSVRNLTCPLLSGDARACADGAPLAMSTRRPLPVSDALVVLQLDLPRP
ncbi:hypothetical protein [Humibacillus xanthopallidus]|uniref:hypothetical protein n=1 Tax=Humibacillus xanthopallidus TaxID=412689 RepID=UPI00384F0356